MVALNIGRLFRPNKYAEEQGISRLHAKKDAFHKIKPGLYVYWRFPGGYDNFSLMENSGKIMLGGSGYYINKNDYKDKLGELDGSYRRPRVIFGNLESTLRFRDWPKDCDEVKAFIERNQKRRPFKSKRTNIGTENEKDIAIYFSDNYLELSVWPETLYERRELGCISNTVALIQLKTKYPIKKEMNDNLKRVRDGGDKFAIGYLPREINDYLVYLTDTGRERFAGAVDVEAKNILHITENDLKKFLKVKKY